MKRQFRDEVLSEEALAGASSIARAGQARGEAAARPSAQGRNCRCSSWHGGPRGSTRRGATCAWHVGGRLFSPALFLQVKLEAKPEVKKEATVQAPVAVAAVAPIAAAAAVPVNRK